MLQSVALAHAEEADFSVADLEGLVGEFLASHRGLLLITLHNDFAHLDEHALHYAVHFGLLVANELIAAFELLAESKEVVACLRRHRVEKFDKNLRVFAIHVEP